MAGNFGFDSYFNSEVVFGNKPSSEHITIEQGVKMWREKVREVRSLQAKKGDSDEALIQFQLGQLELKDLSIQYHHALSRRRAIVQKSNELKKQDMKRAFQRARIQAESHSRAIQRARIETEARSNVNVTPQMEEPAEARDRVNFDYLEAMKQMFDQHQLDVV